MSDLPFPRASIEALGPDYSNDRWKRYADVLRADEYDPAFLRARLADASRYSASEDEAIASVPIHAWRALSQLGDISVIDAVLELADQGHWYAFYDFPRLSANLGDPAIPVLRRVLDDSATSAKKRSLAAAGLGAIGASSGAARHAIVGALMGHLRAEPDDGWVNGHIAEALIEMNERSVAAELLEAYHDGRIRLGLEVGNAIERFADGGGDP